MTRKRPEQDLQVAVMQYIRVVAPEAEAIHIPNGGYRRKHEAAILKGMGVKAGVPDILVMWASGNAAFIELKSPTRRNDVSAAQDRFLERLSLLGIPNAVCCSLDDVAKNLKAWGVPMRIARLPAK